MGATVRRFFVLCAIVAAIAVLGREAGTPYAPPTALAIGEETFTQALPEKIYRGDPSHFGAADANPVGGLNGYCVDVANEGNSAIANGASGFSVTGGIVVSHDTFTNGTPATTSDDIYCVVVQSTGVAGSVSVRWDFIDTDNVTGFAEITLTVVNVILDAQNGKVGVPAVVCTVGWDDEILTGLASNVDDDLPDPLDDVVVADWMTDPGSPTVEIEGNPFVNGGEWCINVSAPAPQADIEVTFDFVHVRSRLLNADDIDHQVSTTVQISDEPDFSELRHVSAGGQIIEERQPPNANVVGATHYACVLPSDADDTLNPFDINFTGGPPAALVSVFHNGSGPIDVQGAPDGTLCFGWTALEPGIQHISLTFEKVGGAFPGPRSVVWDTDGDGNDVDDPGGALPLLKEWVEFGRTEITRNPQLENFVTDQVISVPLVFNVASGTFLFGGGATTTLFEWALGPDGQLVEGVILEARIVTQCGTFVSEDDSDLFLGKEISGVSVEGRFDRTSQGDPLGDGPDDLHVSILGDAFCGPNENLRVEIDAYTQGNGPGDETLVDTEFVEFDFDISGFPGSSVPVIAWAGEIVNVNYAFSFGDVCGDADSTIHFVRSSGPGNFIPDGNLEQDGPDHLFGRFGDECDQTVRYTSEDPGQVMIEVTLDDNPNAKVVFPIFFVAIEDLTMQADPLLFVSERGDVSAAIRAWFPASNPSGREAETKPDGRRLPQDRWILPDDWDVLRATHSDQANWPVRAPMPLLNVTFFMEDESVVNSFHGGVMHGALGWFLLDGTESFLNVNPRTLEPSVLGSFDKPRIITDLTDGDGIATVDSFGDLNLSYEDCEANLPTGGNPHCSPDDVVGRTRWYAIADFPTQFGKWPPVRSDTTETVWLWAGYKRVTVVDTTNPSLKYVVVHLRDRDGFCDAINPNNTLGVEVEFLIDGGPGQIVEASSDPSFVSLGGARANATTFDTLSSRGVPLNTHLVQDPLNEDECQAWVQIANSTQDPTNVVITLPTTPAPLPSEVRVTALQCTGLDETITVTNFGPNVVSLAGFGLQSLPDRIDSDWEQLDLIGLLQPGESKTFRGGPESHAEGWINTDDDEVFKTASDFVQLTWNGYVISRYECDGDIFNPPLGDVFPAAFPPSGEGPLVLDVTVRFGETTVAPIVTGWNLITMLDDVSIEEQLRDDLDKVIVIYSPQPDVDDEWDRYLPDMPGFTSNLTEFEAGRAYWIHAKAPFTLRLEK